MKAILDPIFISKFVIIALVYSQKIYSFGLNNMDECIAEIGSSCPLNNNFWNQGSRSEIKIELESFHLDSLYALSVKTFVHEGIFDL